MKKSSKHLLVMTKFTIGACFISLDPVKLAASQDQPKHPIAANAINV
jgi:hypothetical protein